MTQRTSIPHLLPATSASSSPLPTPTASRPPNRNFQAPAPRAPQCTWPEKQTGGARALVAYLWDEDDFDGRLDTRMWNHMFRFLRFLSLVCASAYTSSPLSSCKHDTTLVTIDYRHLSSLLRHSQHKALGFPLRWACISLQIVLITLFHMSRCYFFRKGTYVRKNILH